MLFTLLDQVRETISELDVQKDAPVMLEQIHRANPDFLDQIRERAKAHGQEKAFAMVAQALGVTMVTLVKEVPQMLDLFVKLVRSGKTDPHLRCALAGVLAYLVQPHDIIPDDAPGGYGFVDDCILLHVGMAHYLSGLPARGDEVGKHVNSIQVLANIVPRPVQPVLAMAVQGVGMTFQLLQMVPPELVELTTRQAIAQPLQMSAPQPPPGFSPPSLPGLGGGHWSGGAYFEGGNVIFPGGASLIDGNVFIPD